MAEHTRRTNLLTDATQLNKRLEQLLKLDLNSDADLLEAALECRFRLAVHPETDPRRAIQLLKECIRLDGPNPRYAYHLGRLWFESGQFDRAGYWLRRASRLCPTSHRIWAHVALLLWELNESFDGDITYEQGALRRRAQQISGRIAEGKDSFDDPSFRVFRPPLSDAGRRQQNRPQAGDADGPAPDEPAGPAPEADPPDPPPKRLLYPNRCRWGGIHDIRIEQMFESAPTQPTLEAIEPLLDTVAKDASRREIGASRFTIVAAQFLTTGYPVTIVSRLLKKSAGAMEGTTCGRLLALLCDLYELPERDLPVVLAQAVGDRQLPPFLGALIHFHRLLWRMPHFEAIYTYQSARQLVASAHSTSHDPQSDNGDPHDQAAGLIRRLDQAWQSMIPDPPRTLGNVSARVDASTEAMTPEAATARLEELETGFVRVNDVRKQLFTFLTGRVEAPLKDGKEAAAVAQARRDYKVFPQAMTLLEEASRRGQEQLADIEEWEASLDRALLPERFSERLGRCQGDAREILNLGNFRRRSRRIDAQLANLGSAEPTAEAITQELADMLDVVRLAFGGATSGADTEPNRPSSPSQKTGIEGVAERLSAVESELDRLHEDALATLDPYGRRRDPTDPVERLRRLIVARQAELAHRMGRRAESTRLWRVLIDTDGAWATPWLNLAISETGFGEVCNELRAWNGYAERLYAESLAANDFQQGAAERVQFHQSVGGAFVPQILLRKPDREWKGHSHVIAIASFLSSRSHVWHFVRHQALRLLNAQLGYTSPTLVLGVGREENSSARERAAERMHGFVDFAARALPESLRPTFVDQAKSRIDCSLRETQESKRLLRRHDTNYPDEHGDQLRILADIATIKLNLILSLMKESEIGLSVSTLAAAPLLDDLDRLPLDLGENLISAAAGSIGVEPEVVCDSKLGNRFVVNVTGAIIRPGEQPHPSRDALYERLVKQWVHHPDVRSYQRLVDFPQHCLSDSMRDALQRGDFGSEELIALRPWVNRCPELAGMGTVVARGLSTAGRKRDAVDVLDRAADCSFYAPSQRSAASLALEICAEALAEGADKYTGPQDVVDRLGRLSRRPDLVKYVVHSMVKRAQSTEEDPGWNRLLDAVIDWGHRAADELQHSAEDDEDGPDYDLDAVNEATDFCKSAVVNIAMLASRGDPNKKPVPIIHAMERVLQQVPDSTRARFLRMIACMSLAAQLSREKSSDTYDRVQEQLKLAVEDAKYVLKHSSDDHEKEQASGVLEQARKHL